MNPDRPWSVSTRVVASGRDHSPGAPINVPLVTASNFVLGSDREYSRGDGTPTWAALEDVVGSLEGGRAVAFSSGMAAVAAVLDRLPVGTRIARPDDGYQGVTSLLDRGASQGRWNVTAIPNGDTTAWVDALPDHDLLWLESPSNPMLVVSDLPEIIARARHAGVSVAVDNTFATPLGQRPLALGAEVVVHSATKFIGGHSDLLCGIAVASDPDIADALVNSRTLSGATPGALEAFLAVRGVRTLAVRLERSTATAQVLAERLSRHASVTAVHYPGLPSHPTHAVAERTLDGFGSMVSFETVGTASEAEAVIARLALIQPATSLGGVESTIERRQRLAGQEHVPATLLRLSVGCEDAEDLWGDLERALSTTT